MPGYWRNPELSAKAFDDEGFYLIGDAVRLADPADPARGLIFDGRVAEDFKLSSGTWVNVGGLRLRAVESMAPIAQDVVVCGHDRGDIRLLVFVNAVAARQFADLPADTAPEQVIQAPAVRARVAAGLAAGLASAIQARICSGLSTRFLHAPGSGCSMLLRHSSRMDRPTTSSSP